QYPWRQADQAPTSPHLENFSRALFDLSVVPITFYDQSRDMLKTNVDWLEFAKSNLRPDL
ncbi:MAG: hypothetical protein LBJ59_01095, partial [Zoogloeaceae bacterium]|nr:hypothetical protein [Zoogloeaceae bacterium]